jgi:ribosomal protein L12E/L44/L45/RPP1/RPP2
MESDMIKEAMAYSPIWIDELVKKEQLKAAAAAQPAPESDVEAAIREQQIDEESVPFSEEDRETLLKLPKKTCSSV